MNEDELRGKRIYVGLLSIGCLTAGAALWASSEYEMLQSTLLRVGLLLGAFWLALPSKNRSAAWARASPWSVGIVILIAVLLPRLKYMLPLLIVGIVVAVLVRPRRKLP